jgi:hypothetical protein
MQARVRFGFIVGFLALPAVPPARVQSAAKRERVG